MHTLPLHVEPWLEKGIKPLTDLLYLLSHTLSSEPQLTDSEYPKWLNESFISPFLHSIITVSQKFVKIREIIAAVRKNKSLWIYSSCFGANQSDNSCTEEATTGQALKKTKNKRKATDRSLIQPSVRNVEETAGDGSYTRDAEGFSPAAELVSEAGGAQPEPSVAFLGVVLLLPLQCTWCHFDLCGLFFLSFTDSGSDCRNQAFP